ncbi:MAG: TlyA family RNA methyltransferase [Propionibacteriaceae bacterium]|jgi:23S rRNA (cytidine1920-2'-O)/16S rRNA (cytidine1409-2'-O)-methyltransferase|nr:TlyA family RNA methyltransferase [Propionibacteriaceae bacterium]
MRLDLALVERGLARSRSHARQLIEAGRVTIPFQTSPKPSIIVGSEIQIEVEVDPYVSRGAHKLIHALDHSGLVITGRVLDAGASTGGFTQVLLERGVTQVYAVDVGHDQMVENLRHDPRVVLREGLNLRELSLNDVENQRVDYVVADVSFISLTMILEPILAVLKPEGAALVLVKPQFEVGRGGLDSHGVVVDELVRAQAVTGVIEHARTLGWFLDWSAPSAVVGEKGNQETFCLFRSHPS